MARSHKPIVWGLFAAGGTLAAFVFPVLVLIVSLGVPMGLIPAEVLAYENLNNMLSQPLAKLLLFGILTLLLWHAAHRMRITMHDLGIRADATVAFAFYSIAATATLALLLALLQI